MKTITKTLGAIAIAGVIAAGGTAFTAGGLSLTADDTVSLGGTVTQTINGTLVISDIAYQYVADNSGNVDQATLTFTTTAAGRDVSVSANGGVDQPCNAGTTTVVCPITAINLNTLAVTVADA
jgi:hypothetical protein